MKRLTRGEEFKYIKKCMLSCTSPAHKAAIERMIENYYHKWIPHSFSCLPDYRRLSMYCKDFFSKRIGTGEVI